MDWNVKRGEAGERRGCFGLWRNTKEYANTQKSCDSAKRSYEARDISLLESVGQCVESFAPLELCSVNSSG